MNIQFGFKLSGNRKLTPLEIDNYIKVLNVIAKAIMNNGVDHNGYTEISAKKFKDAYSGYNKYLKSLMHLGLIDRDYYVVSKKSFGYRFSEYFKERTKIKTIYIDKKPSKLNNKPLDIPISINLDKRLKKDFRSVSLVYSPYDKPLKKTYDQWDNFIDIGKWLVNNVKMANWKKGNLSYQWKSKRLYTNFTYLSSHIRTENILLDGEKLIEFDIPNSFPLFLSLYCLQQKPNLKDDYDFKHYVELVVEKKIYDYLQGKANNLRNVRKSGDEGETDTRLITRTEMKLVFQQYLNGNNNKLAYVNGVQVDINYIMRNHFPFLHDTILELKKEFEGVSDVNSTDTVDHRNIVYHTITELETNFIFDIVDDLYKTYPDIKILTVHDAIYVPKSYKSKVEEIWNKYIENLIEPLNYQEEVEWTDEMIKNMGMDVCDF